MKNKGTVIQDKIDSLDTLSSGIVYGKEDAWGKLQVRMDGKSAKRIPFKYWMSAAVLLLAVFISGFYFYPSKKIVSSKGNETTNGSLNSTASMLPKQAAMQQPMIAPRVAVASINGGNKIKGAVLKVPHTSEESSTITPPTHNENTADNNIAVVEPPPVIPAKTPMKVVQINDFENGKMEHVTPAIVLNMSPSIDISKMPVVHITDVVKEEYEVKKLRRENRMTFGRNIFTRPDYNDHHSNLNTEDYNESHHLLKNIFNTQN